MQPQAIIVFVRNPTLGKVKTRLAQTLGNEKALEIYQKLLLHTNSVIKEVACDKFIFYTDYINENDMWDATVYKKYLQTEGDLGNRITHAFEIVFTLGYQQVCIVGSDCNELTNTIITNAFAALQTNDFVIGPSTDGGYYLLGMQQLLHPLFINIHWSTDVVLSQTIHAIHNAEKTYFLLPALTDIDEEVNVPAEWL